MQYELKVQESWNRNNPSIRNIEDKIALPILRETKQGELQVNFDESFYALLKESEKLMKLDIPLPSVNQFLVKRKTWFHEYKSMVEMMLASHGRALGSVSPEWKRLFAPFLANIRGILEPGLGRMNWYCQDWEEFTTKCTEEIAIFQDLIDRANDIYTNRIHMILDSMDSVELYKLPKKEAWTFQQFLDTVRDHCQKGTEILDQKSKMVEEAVEDTIQLALEALARGEEGESGLARQGSRSSDMLTVQDREQTGVMSKITMDIRKNYSKKILEKLEVITRNALKHLTKYFSSSLVEQSSRAIYEFEESEGTDYSFILTTVLTIPTIEVQPTIEQIQSSMVAAGNLIMSVSKGVGQWIKVLPKKKVAKKNSGFSEDKPRVKPKLYNPVKKTKVVIDEKPNNFYGQVSENKEVTKAMAQLSSCMAGMKVELSRFNERWLHYQELWEVDR
jgi:dynein heavy chain